MSENPFVAAGNIDIEAFVEEARMTMALLRRWLDQQLSSDVVTLEDGTVFPASGIALLDLGAPAMDRRWHVRRINVSPQDPTVTSTAVAYVFRGNNVQHPMMYVDRTQTPLPVQATWEEKQFTLRPSEALLIRVTGGTAGQRIFASAQVLEEPIDVVPIRDGVGVLGRLIHLVRGAG